jgi:hypothetical protein
VAVTARGLVPPPVRRHFLPQRQLQLTATDRRACGRTRDSLHPATDVGERRGLWHEFEDNVDWISVTIGDMADVPAAGPFRLVYLIFNKLFKLLSPDGRKTASATSPASSTRTAHSSSNASCPTRPCSTGDSESRRWQ